MYNIQFILTIFFVFVRLLESRKLDSNSLTKTKSWSGWNEVAETSGGPLWPQNKWLHTPRTADYRHTRQDRWIQTELAFTLNKECHKTESLWNHTTTDCKEGEQLEDRRSVGESSCNCGDGTDQTVQSLMFMMMMIMTYCIVLTAQLISISTYRQYSRHAATAPTQHNDVNHSVFLNCKFSKEQYMLPEDDRVIETCRSVENGM